MALSREPEMVEVRSLEKLLVRVDEAAALLSLGKSKTYSLVQSGEIPSVRLGRSVRIPVQALKDWANAQQEMTS